MRKVLGLGASVWAAVALVACGDDGAVSSDTDGGSTSTSTAASTENTAGMTATTETTEATGTSGTSRTSGDTETTGSGTTQGESTTGGTDTTASTEGSTGDGSTSSGSTGEGTTGGAQVSLTPAEVCPFSLAAYSTGTAVAPWPGYTPFSGVVPEVGTDDMFVLHEGTEQADRFNLRGHDSGRNPCVVAGDGDDLVEIEYGTGISTTSPGFATISLGLGADTVAIRPQLDAPGVAGLDLQEVVDFEPGVDRVFIDTSTALVGLTPSTPILEQAYDPGDANPANTSFIIDAADGELWLVEGGATAGEGFTQLLEFQDGIDVTADDIDLVDLMPGCPRTYGEPATEDFRGWNTGNGNSAADPLGSVPSPGAAFSSVSLLSGGAGEDNLWIFQPAGICVIGRDGDDILRMAYPRDVVLVGGPGSDIFAFGLDFASTFSASTGADAATISDFEPGVDTLAIAPGIFGVGTVDDATVTFGSYNGEAGQGSSIIVDVADGEVWVTEEAGGSVFVNLTGSPAITEQDIALVPDPS